MEYIICAFNNNDSYDDDNNDANDRRSLLQASKIHRIIDQGPLSKYTASTMILIIKTCIIIITVRRLLVI